MGKLEDLADKLLDLKMQKDQIDEMYEQVKSKFVEELKAAHKYDQNTKAIGDVRVKLVPNNYFDTEAAFASLPKRLQKEVTVTVPDPKKIKQHLTPIQLEEFIKPYDNPFKLSVSVLED